MIAEIVIIGCLIVIFGAALSALIGGPLQDEPAKWEKPFLWVFEGLASLLRQAGGLLKLRR